MDKVGTMTTHRTTRSRVKRMYFTSSWMRQKEQYQISRTLKDSFSIIFRISCKELHDGRANKLSSLVQYTSISKKIRNQYHQVPDKLRRGYSSLLLDFKICFVHRSLVFVLTEVLLKEIELIWDKQYFTLTYLLHVPRDLNTSSCQIFIGLSLQYGISYN